MRLLLLLVLAIIFCTVSADQMGLISSSDELINGPEDGNSQYTNPGSWALTPSEAAINDVGIGIAPSIMVDESAGAGAGLAGNSIKAVDNCANIPKNSRRGVQVQLRKKRQPPDWCDNRQKPATFSGTSGGDSDSDGTISDPTREAPPKATPILKPKPGSDSDGDDTNSAPTRKAPPKAKPILKPKPAGDTSTIQQPPTTSEAEESTFKDLQQVFLRLGGGTICNTQLEYFRYQYPVCFPYAMGGKGRRFSANRAWWENWFGLTVESGSLRKDLFPCRPSKLGFRKYSYFEEEKRRKKIRLLDFLFPLFPMGDFCLLPLIKFDYF